VSYWIVLVSSYCTRAETTVPQIEQEEQAIFEEIVTTNELRFAFIANCPYDFPEVWMITRLIIWHILVYAIDFWPFNPGRVKK
jgi:hypothetical protein